MAAKPFLPVRHPVTETGSVPLMTVPWQKWATQIHSLFVSINQIPGVNRKTLAELNALGLGADDEGYLSFEHVFGHWLRWTGAVWQFAPGDPGNGFFSLRAVAPQEVGWQLCDGTATTYLTVGATLTTTAFTPPDLVGTTAYLKTIAAYTGTISAASGSTGTDGAHDHTFADSGQTGGPNGTSFVAAGADDSMAHNGHDHDFSVSGTTSNTGAHSHAPNTLELRRLGVLPYFRR